MGAFFGAVLGGFFGVFFGMIVLAAAVLVTKKGDKDDE